MHNNWKTAIGYICIALVFITMYLGAAWVMSPSEFTFKIEMDNNTKEAIESIEWENINDEDKELRCEKVNGTITCPKGENVFLGEFNISCDGDSRQIIEWAKWNYNNGTGREYKDAFVLLDEGGSE